MKNRAVTDIETGGFSVTKNGIVEIAFLIIDHNYEIIDTFSQLVKPYHRRDSIELMSYTDEAEGVHGYTLETLRSQGEDPREVCDAADAILDQYKVTEFIGHNIHKFDKPRLVEFWERFSGVDAGQRFPVTTDTQEAARLELNSQSYALGALCEGLGIIHEGAHTAAGDCHATLELAKYLNL